MLESLLEGVGVVNRLWDGGLERKKAVAVGPKGQYWSGARVLNYAIGLIQHEE